MDINKFYKLSDLISVWKEAEQNATPDTRKRLESILTEINAHDGVFPTKISWAVYYGGDDWDEYTSRVSYDEFFPDYFSNFDITADDVKFMNEDDFWEIYDQYMDDNLYFDRSKSNLDDVFMDDYYSEKDAEYYWDGESWCKQ